MVVEEEDLSLILFGELSLMVHFFLFGLDLPDAFLIEGKLMPALSRVEISCYAGAEEEPPNLSFWIASHDWSR